MDIEFDKSHFLEALEIYDNILKLYIEKSYPIAQGHCALFMVLMESALNGNHTKEDFLDMASKNWDTLKPILVMKGAE